MIDALSVPFVVAMPDGFSVACAVRVHLVCGCSVYIGSRSDNDELATVARSCRPSHKPIAETFNDKMRESLVDGGTDRLLADVCEELLVEAYAEHEQAKRKHPFRPPV